MNGTYDVVNLMKIVPIEEKWAAILWKSVDEIKQHYDIASAHVKLHPEYNNIFKYYCEHVITGMLQNEIKELVILYRLNELSIHKHDNDYSYMNEYGILCREWHVGDNGKLYKQKYNMYIDYNKKLKKNIIREEEYFKDLLSVLKCHSITLKRAYEFWLSRVDTDIEFWRNEIIKEQNKYKESIISRIKYEIDLKPNDLLDDYIRNNPIRRRFRQRVERVEVDAIIDDNDDDIVPEGY
jgi:hypothetical protein